MKRLSEIVAIKTIDEGVVTISKQKLKSIKNQAMRAAISDVVVAHRDDFNFEMIPNIAKKYNVSPDKLTDALDILILGESFINQKTRRASMLSVLYKGK